MSNELDELKKRVAELEAAANPPPQRPHKSPHDYSANLSLPKSAMRALVENVPDSLVAGLRSDARYNPVSAPVVQLTNQQPTTGKRGSAWRDEVPLESPPGQRHIDAIVSAQDRIDRVELIRKLAQAELSKGEG